MSAVVRKPEQGSTLCQDRCASILLPRLCRPDATFVDIGAHLGSVFTAVRRHSPSVNILAIEASPDKAAYLSRRFQGIQVFNVAVGEMNGEAVFYVNKRRSGYSSLLRPAKTDSDITPIRVQVRRLDDVVPSELTVDLMKIDVEGAELAAMRGAHRLVKTLRPSVMFESVRHSGESGEHDVLSLFDWFSSRDYQIVIPNRLAHDGPALCREAFLESHFYPRRTTNYFAVAGERRQELRDLARRILGVKTS